MYKIKSYCLKCRKLKTYLQEIQVLVMVKQWYYENVQYMVVKNQGLLKIKKQKDYYAI